MPQHIMPPNLLAFEHHYHRISCHPLYCIQAPTVQRNLKLEEVNGQRERERLRKDAERQMVTRELARVRDPQLS